jgi:hypothetical protein
VRKDVLTSVFVATDSVPTQVIRFCYGRTENYLNWHEVSSTEIVILSVVLSKPS